MSNKFEARGGIKATSVYARSGYTVVLAVLTKNEVRSVTALLRPTRTWGPLELLKASTKSILCLGLTEPSMVAKARPCLFRCHATTCSMLVHWETTTLEGRVIQKHQPPEDMNQIHRQGLNTS